MEPAFRNDRPTLTPETFALDHAVWQRMLSGRRLDLLDPSPLDIEIADIAHGLARVARWNGQTSGAHIFSVAQHTLLVEAVMREQMPRVDARFRLAALLHDAPEYVIGDMISPFKAVLGGDYKVVEKRLLAAIHIRFGLPPVLPDEITPEDQGRRPRRGLSRSDASGGLCRSRGQAPVRQGSRPARGHRARLPDAVDGGKGREAVFGAIQAIARLTPRRTGFHRPARGPIIAITSGTPRDHHASRLLARRSPRPSRPPAPVIFSP